MNREIYLGKAFGRGVESSSESYLSQEGRYLQIFR